MPRYFKLDVALQEIQPRIRRRFLIRTTSTSEQLHKAIQQSYGWWESHLWEFRLPTFNGMPIAGLPTDDDFGDSWCHDVKLIRVVSDEKSFKQRLLAGDRACPPEDCGGVSGYERMVHFVQTGEDILEDDPEGLRTWLGGWRPDAFDLAAAKEKFDR